MGTDIWGIDDGYEDALGVWRETLAATRSALRTAMGVNSTNPVPRRSRRCACSARDRPCRSKRRRS